MYGPGGICRCAAWRRRRPSRVCVRSRTWLFSQPVAQRRLAWLSALCCKRSGGARARRPVRRRPSSDPVPADPHCRQQAGSKAPASRQWRLPSGLRPRPAGAGDGPRASPRLDHGERLDRLPPQAGPGPSIWADRGYPQARWFCGRPARGPGAGTFWVRLNLETAYACATQKAGRSIGRAVFAEAPLTGAAASTERSGFP